MLCTVTDVEIGISIGLTHVEVMPAPVASIPILIPHPAPPPGLLLRQH